MDETEELKDLIERYFPNCISYFEHSASNTTVAQLPLKELVKFWLNLAPFHMRVRGSK